MKTVYFVRHGESESNAGHATFLGETSKLTELGRQQGRFIAKRCSKLPIDVVLASTTIRAQETAQFIAEETSKHVEIEALFTERRLPSALLGMSRKDPEARKLEGRWFRSFYEDGVRADDGENFAELRQRAEKALTYLAERPESHILVVSHGFFLRMILAQVILGGSVEPEEFQRLAKAVLMDNTGLSMLTHGEQFLDHIDSEPSERWIVKVWNDHAHLG